MERPGNSERPPLFLVERYWPGVNLGLMRDAIPRLEAAARAMAAEGTPVEHVGSILIPQDDVVFSFIAALDEGLVRDVNERADMPFDRITSAVPLPASGGSIP